MKKKAILISSAIVLLILSLWWYNSSIESSDLNLSTTVKRGEFKSLVVTSGELMAKNSTRIEGPREVRKYRINEMKIDDLVPEGTLVKKGDYVGRLDPSQISNQQKDLLNELDQIQSKYTQTTLDTALELRAKRDEIKNMKFGLEEREIEVKYSEFEPPAIQRQAQINLEKAQRAYKNAKESYLLKKRQSVAQVQEVAASLAIKKSSLENLLNLIKEFTIYAPQDGMVIYARDWNGRKRTVGSTISSWNPAIAELPDMAIMLSKTYVNEVDISKIKKDQSVEIGIDAFPDKQFKGKITYVANVGEDMPNADGKAFEVTIQLLETDSIFRPGMTTSNKILIFEEKDALYVPLECINTQDSINYVVVQSTIGKRKQEVKLGKANENEIIILEGLKEDEEVLLSLPDGMEESPIEKLAI